MFEARWYQEEAEQSIFDYFGARPNQPGNPVVALPTGTGKSVVIARFARRALMQWPSTRIMMLTHVKELITQNANKLLQEWPNAPLGIHSAGLRQRDIALPIIYGGIGTVKNKIEAFGPRDLLLIDEAHLLSQSSETMYQKTIAGMLALNPWMKVIGFTATPYRMKQGMITDDGIFTDICYDATTPAMFNRLIAEGYICPPIPKRTNTFIDVSDVDIVGGEFAKGGLEAAADKDDITFAAVKETVEYGYNRASWLMFGAGIHHCETIASMLQSLGIAAAAVHSGLSDDENDKRMKAFKRGTLRAIVNMGKLTTGFDHPPIDLIGMLRPTMSPGLWVQMIGRGTRPYDYRNPGSEINPHWFPYVKQNVLVLDFARNTPRLGPINDPIKPRKPGKGGGDAPVRICTTGTDGNGNRVKGCDTYNHASARFCINCGIAFDFETKIFGSAGNEELLNDDAPQVKSMPVSKVIYNLHEKTGGLPSMQVTYFCGFQRYNEWVCLEHSGYAGKNARDWWRQRHKEEPPETIAEALKRTSELRVPSHILIWMNCKPYPRVLKYEY